PPHQPLTSFPTRRSSDLELSDEGHTYMHLTYELESSDLLKGTRQKIISNALSMFSVQERDGELWVAISNGNYGDALYSFSQALRSEEHTSELQSRENIVC